MSRGLGDVYKRQERVSSERETERVFRADLDLPELLAKAVQSFYCNALATSS